MAQTLGQRLADINTKIDKAENAQSYQNGDKQVSRGLLFRMYKERDSILSKIEQFGVNYIEGQTTSPKKAFAHVSFR